MIETLVFVFVCLLPVLLLLVGFIVALGQRPGFRRRHDDPNYSGVERRGSNKKSNLSID